MLIKRIYFYYLSLLPVAAVLSLKFSNTYEPIALIQNPFWRVVFIFAGLFAFALYFGSLEIIPFPKNRAAILGILFLPAIEIAGYLYWSGSEVLNFFNFHFITTTLGFFLMVIVIGVGKNMLKEAWLAILIFLYAVTGIFSIFLIPLIQKDPWVVLVFIVAIISELFFFYKAYKDESERQTSEELMFPIIIGMLSASIALFVVV